MPPSEKEIRTWLVDFSKKDGKASDIVLDVLSTNLQTARSSLKMGRTPSGKPIFLSHPDLHLSYAHTKGKLFIGLSTRGPIGVDIESADRKTQWQAIAKRFFHSDEHKYLETFSVQEAPHEFIRIWTGKETYVKCTGAGIAGEFGSFTVLENLPGYELSHMTFEPNIVAAVVLKMSS